MSIVDVSSKSDFDIQCKHNAVKILHLIGLNKFTKLGRWDNYIICNRTAGTAILLGWE